MALVVDRYITVLERDGLRDTNINIQNGDWMDIAASGQIWAGVWWTGTNGPQGWAGWRAGADNPLEGAPPYCLLGYTAEDGYFYIGQGLRRPYQNATLGPGQTRLSLEINDNSHGNGNGAFTVRIQVWR